MPCQVGQTLTRLLKERSPATLASGPLGGYQGRYAQQQGSRAHKAQGIEEERTAHATEYDEQAAKTGSHGQAQVKARREQRVGGHQVLCSHQCRQGASPGRQKERGQHGGAGNQYEQERQRRQPKRHEAEEERLSAVAPHHQAPLVHTISQCPCKGSQEARCDLDQQEQSNRYAGTDPSGSTLHDREYQGHIGNGIPKQGDSARAPEDRIGRGSPKEAKRFSQTRHIATILSITISLSVPYCSPGYTGQMDRGQWTDGQ